MKQNKISFEMEHFTHIELFQSDILVVIEQLFTLLVELKASCELIWLETLRKQYLTKKQIIWLYVVLSFKILAVLVHRS